MIVFSITRKIPKNIARPAVRSSLIESPAPRYRHIGKAQADQHSQKVQNEMSDGGPADVGLVDLEFYDNGEAT